MRRKAYQWTLPDAIERRLGPQTYGRQRIIDEDDHLLIILHALPDPPEFEVVHEVYLRTPGGELQCNGLPGGEPRLRKLVNRYRQRFEELEQKYDAADTSKAYFDILEELVPVTRACKNLAITLQSAREAVRLDAFILEMRDATHELQRDFELLLSDAKSALNYRIARNAEKQSAKADEAVEAQHRLNVLAAVFFPLTALATVFGMNFRHGYENQSPVLFWAVSATGLAIGLFVKQWVVARRGRDSRQDR